MTLLTPTVKNGELRLEDCGIFLILKILLTCSRDNPVSMKRLNVPVRPGIDEREMNVTPRGQLSLCGNARLGTNGW